MPSLKSPVVRLRGVDQRSQASLAEQAAVRRGRVREWFEIDSDDEVDEAPRKRNRLRSRASGGGQVKRRQLLEYLDQPALGVIDACGVEPVDHVPDEHESDVRAALDAIPQRLDDSVDALEPLRRELVRDVDRRRGGVVNRLEQGFFAGAPTVRQPP